MYDVMITSRNIEALNGAGVIESGTLSYSKISEKHTQANSSGKAQSPFTTGYDLKEAKKL
jgi:type VI protein secretion system component Hcp